MKKTYADECLERAEKATEGPWKRSSAGKYVTSEFSGLITSEDELTLTHQICSSFCIDWEVAKDLSKWIMCHGAFRGSSFDNTQGIVNGDFIAHARTDVPELAKHLKLAVECLKGAALFTRENGLFLQELDDVIKRLEEPLEGNK